MFIYQLPKLVDMLAHSVLASICKLIQLNYFLTHGDLLTAGVKSTLRVPWYKRPRQSMVRLHLHVLPFSSSPTTDIPSRKTK